jgi:hypothetical protein
MAEEELRPARWLRDLRRFVPLKSQFVISGNTRDLQVHEATPGVFAAVPLMNALGNELLRWGYGQVFVYQPIIGFRAADLTGPTRLNADDLLSRIGLMPADGLAPAGIELLGTALERFVALEGPPVAMVIDFASRLIVRNDALSPAEHQLFTRALLLSHTARPRPSGEDRVPFFNTIIWIVDKEGDIPDWFLIGNPRIRHIPIAKPDHLARGAVAPQLLRSLPGGQKAPQDSIAKANHAFIDETEGLLLLDMNAIAQLGRSEAVDFKNISDAVRRYKVGVTEDPWQKIDRAKLRRAKDFVHQRVKGQDHAVIHMLDIVKRAVTGVGRSRRGAPRGIAFLAGPTGVGKTELAKTITSLLFGDDSAYIRFDMSEFSAEHADQRLIGAPPGYVGYDVGGELTNAIREKPFSVVLFDEIEKAHPRILDKFLQVLDDGVLTSGRGERVYFSESFIVFTSNLGIYSLDSSGARVLNVTAEEPLEAVSTKVRAEIEKHFKLVLNRPEILNRIGENIIVFDFIRKDVAVQIFEQMVDGLLSDVAQLGFAVTLSPQARNTLRRLCLADLSNGGRGIRNQVETLLINPLSRALFDSNARPGARYEVGTLAAEAIASLSLIEIGGC